ncbi:poly [ADP-ribose] polymerase 2 isoform X5 [Trachemys scripta elegans]|uniref:poly [ADP-ribose] polymerase 2 isoform X5 n=1 Tax=Trachemys scripta elegans TaxID=31138 RepID=UPI001552A6BA|nr:poly [ADP-ribose] polymerase 2 isoform X5 [Trachemys scripta elegans]
MHRASYANDPAPPANECRRAASPVCVSHSTMRAYLLGAGLRLLHARDRPGQGTGLMQMSDMQMRMGCARVRFPERCLERGRVGAAAPRMRRKQRATEAGGAGLALELRWEWQDSGGTWHRFVPEQSEVLTQAARAGKPSVAVGSRVDLRRMVQRDGQTGQDRCVAAAVQDQDSYFVWCWQGDEEGQWLPYPADTCLALERARRGDGGPSLEVTFSRTRYTLDTAQMTQTNIRTGYQRRMERRESDAVDDDGGSEPSSVPGSSSPQGPPAPKRPRDGGASPNPGARGESTEVIKTLIVKGKAPVDPECLAKLGKAHVYCEGDDVYDVMLNQTNLQFNNNKFYVLQLLEDDGPQSYSVWTRWGRVGRPGQHALVSCAGDLAQAKEIFTKKFLDKTKNHWAERCNFQKVPGKYDLLHMDSRPPAAELSCAGASQPKPASRLDPRVQALLGLICDLQAMEEMVLEMKYDTKKAPLGKLTVEQIRAGFQSLQKVEAVLRAGDTGRALLEACNEFYTRVPHDFGPSVRSRSPSSWHTWSCMARSTRWTEATARWAVSSNPWSGTLPTSSSPQVLERYLLSTHAPTHRDYSMELLEAFTLRRAGEPPFRTSLSNRTLLWHGSRLGNWVGILSQGLRVAPPEAPVTGYMFGKGIYFADMSSKSANYCFASHQRDVGLLLLCEVALGECQELLEANAEAGKLPPGKHSTKGLGKLAPAPTNSIMLDGAAVPLGPAVETGVTNPHGYTLNYNEFVVYDPGQVRMRYLLQVRFSFVPLW